MVANALSGDVESTVESVLGEWLNEEGIPGAAVAIVDGDDVVYAEGFGERTLEGNDPATPDTLFGVGSCTKPFVAATVFRLAEEGRLDLADPIADFLPHLADAPGDPITVRELLSHTSGMPVDHSAGTIIDRAIGSGSPEVAPSNREEFRRHVEESVDRRITDRETFNYYNSGYVLLGLLVEERTGESIATAVEDRVLAPLGMGRSTFSEDAFRAADDRMTPYVDGEEGVRETAFPFDPLLHAPGGLLSSVRETAAFLGALIGEGTYRGRQVLSPESVAEMARPVATVGTYLDGREAHYGHGLAVEEFLGDRLLGHSGSISVSCAWLGVLRDAELGVAIACTTTPETHPESVGRAVLAVLRGEDPENAVAHYRLRSALDAVVGTYAGYRNVAELSVERSGCSLSLVFGPDDEEVCHPTRVADDRLVCTAVFPEGMEREVRFEIGDDGVDLFFEGARFSKSS